VNNNPARVRVSFLAESSEDAMKKIAIVLFLLASLSCLAQVDSRNTAPFQGGVNGSRISPSFINNTCMADQQTGIDMGAKIAACNTLLASQGNGIIDATGFTGTQYASVGFTLGPGVPTTNTTPAYSVTLKLGYVVLIAGGEIKMSPFTRIQGQSSSIFGGISSTIIVGKPSTATQLAVIDMTGCAHCLLEDVDIATNAPASSGPPYVPKVGISISRNPAAACGSNTFGTTAYICAAGNNTIRNVSAWGYFQNAAFYAVGSELLTLEHFYGYVYDGATYPGGVKPKYCMVISQADVLGLGLYSASTMTMGSIENSECWYSPTGVSGSAAIYFGGGSHTNDWSFRNVYLAKSNLGSYIEIQNNENNGGSLNGPLLFENVDGEVMAGGNPNSVYYIHGTGQVNELYIIGGGTMGGVNQYINATANLQDAYIDSQSYMSSGTQTSSFATVWNSTIKLPWQNTTIFNALASTLEGGANSNCGACGLTVTGTNTSIIEPAFSTNPIQISGPSFANPTLTGTVKTPLTTAGVVTTTRGGVLGSAATVPQSNGGFGAAVSYAKCGIQNLLL
jgi:hypothetical protein